MYADVTFTFMGYVFSYLFSREVGIQEGGKDKTGGGTETLSLSLLPWERGKGEYANRIA